MQNIPKDYSSADYEAYSFLYPGIRPERDVRLQHLPGPMAVVAVHLNDSGNEYMRGLVAQAEAVMRSVGDKLSQLLLINSEGDPPPELAANPRASVVGDFELLSRHWREEFLQQHRVALIGWEARACVAQTLEALTMMLPADEPAEFHFPLGALDDGKLDDIPSSEAKVMITTLMGFYARNVARQRGRTDLSFDGVYLARHEEGGPGTSLHFYSSVDAFGSSLNG